MDSGESAQTLAALRNPGAGLYGVTSECAQTYQDDLWRVKGDKKAEGEERNSGTTSFQRGDESEVVCDDLSAVLVCDVCFKGNGSRYFCSLQIHKTPLTK